MKGKLLWLLWLIAAAALYFFENNSGTRLILAASVLMPLLLMLPLLIKSGRARLSFEAPEREERGSSAAVSVNITYENPALRLLGTELLLYTEYLLTGDGGSLSPVFSGDGRASASIELKHCGMVKLKAELWGRDAFGICRKKLLAEAETSLFSSPQLSMPFINLVEDTESSGDGGSFSANRPGNDPSETFGIREYQPGDPIRQIHWKLSEKTGKTMLRELGMPVSSRAVIVLDLAGSAFPDEMTELFFSVSRSMMLSEQDHSLCWKHREELQPRLFSVESEQDLGAAMNEFFGAAPEREVDLGSLSFGSSFAHGLLICSSLPDTEGGSGFGGRLTAAFPAAGSYPEAPGGVHLLPFRPESFKEDLARIDF